MKHVTLKMATDTLAAVVKTFGAYIQPNYGPVIHTDWDGHEFVIIWEEGPFDWPQLMDGGATEWGNEIQPAKLPAGVWLEPVNSCVIGIYRL